MIYAISDLHGTNPENLKKLLEKAGYGGDDFLYILGDVIDRGEHSAELLKYIMQEPSFELILGNHEAMMLTCSFIANEITDDSISEIDGQKISCLINWMQNGGDSTINGLRALKQTDPCAVGDIFDFISDAPLYETVSAGGKDFLLTHSGLGNFDKNKKIRDYAADDLLWNRPKITDRYFDDIITVFGHTPTFYIDPKHKGKILKTPTWIDIDAGASAGLMPTLLRLDDLKEFYL